MVLLHALKVEREVAVQSGKTWEIIIDVAMGD
jgi:hypothetical protein